MLQIERKGTQVQVKILCPENNYTYTFNYDCGNNAEDYAILLRHALNTGFMEALKDARNSAYLAGWKDAKGKKAKQNWFSGNL